MDEDYLCYGFVIKYTKAVESELLCFFPWLFLDALLFGLYVNKVKFPVLSKAVIIESKKEQSRVLMYLFEQKA